MKLLGAPLSPFVRKARIVALEKGIDYDYDPKPSPLGWPDDYADINPLRRIPALLPDGDNPDFAINDSSPICAYFEKLVPEPVLYPSEPEAYGRALWFEELADSGLGEMIGLGCFRPVLFNVFSGKEPDYETADAGFEKLAARLLTYLEKQLVGCDWLAGDGFSIADIGVTTQLINLSHSSYELWPERFPNLAAHFERCKRRESIAKFIADDVKMLEGMGVNLARRML